MKYDEFYEMDRPFSKRQKMTLDERAAQFSPFAALTGFDVEIDSSYERYEAYKKLRLGTFTGKLTKLEFEILEHLAKSEELTTDELISLIPVHPEKLLSALDSLEKKRLIRCVSEEFWIIDRENQGQL